MEMFDDIDAGIESLTISDITSLQIHLAPLGLQMLRTFSPGPSSRRALPKSPNAAARSSEFSGTTSCRRCQRVHQLTLLEVGGVHGWM